jgi:hypothetical protein
MGMDSDSKEELWFKSQILQIQTVMPEINQRVKVDRKYHKHFAVVLKQDASIDLYFDFNKVETIMSTSDATLDRWFVNFDLSFRMLHLQAINISK